MSTSVARRRGLAAAAALAVAAGSLVAGGATAASGAAERTAGTAVDTTYLTDTLGLSETDTRVETVTYDRFQWLLQQPGQFAFVVGSPSDAFKTQIQAVDAAAKAKGVSRIYWFDPNLSGYTGLRNLDTRNPSGITSIGAASQTIYGHTWKNVLAQYLGNGYKATIDGAKITTASDDTVVNDAVDPLWDYRSTATVTPVGASDNVFFLYDRDGTVGSGEAAPKDKVRAGVNLSVTPTPPATQATLIDAAIDAVGAANVDRVDQFAWWQAENNRRLTAQGPANVYGSKVLEDTDDDAGWNVQQLTYPELIHLLDVKDSADKNFVILFGGTWCPNTRAVIKDVNKQAVANGVKVYNFDTVLDGGVVGGGTTSSNNPIQIRNNAIYSSGGSTTLNYAPSFLYGDLLRTYLRNIVTQYDPNNAAGDRVLYYPKGDVTAAPDVVRKLQVPFLVNYQRGNGNSVPRTTIKRQWIQQNVDPSTGLPTFREYMSQVWYTNPSERIGLRDSDFPFTLPIPSDPLNAPNSAVLTPAELASTSTSAGEKDELADSRRSSVAAALEALAFGQEAVAKLRLFFSGLPGAVVSAQTVTAPAVTYGTAPKVTLAVTNEHGRVPTGPATLTVAGKSYTVNLAQNAAAFTLPKLVPGSYGYTVRYAGDDQVVAFQKTGTLTVRKAKVSKVAGVVKKAPTTKKAGTYAVSVATSTGLAKASGKVTVTLTKGKSRKTVSGTVRSGAATVKVPKLKKGKWRVSLAYAGSGHYLAANGTGSTISVKKLK